MLPLGSSVFDFSLPDVTTGKNITLSDFQKKEALLIMFICRHCPYIQHVQNEIARIGQDYRSSTLGIVTISSNDAEAYPDDALESFSEMAKELKFTLLFLMARKISLMTGIIHSVFSIYYLLVGFRTLSLYKEFGVANYSFLNTWPLLIFLSFAVCSLLFWNYLTIKLF